MYQNFPDVDQNLISLDIYVPTFNLTNNIHIDFKSIKNKSSTPFPNQIKKNILSENNKMPVMIWVHGSGWIQGDKANSLDYKIPFFINNGWIFVSVNYRLSPEDLPTSPSELNPDRIKYPVHSQDVTSAISWAYTTIYQYGGDPDYISIMGHSAGTGIVASIGTNKSFLEEHELCFDIIRHVICLDTAAYDIRNRCEMGSMLYLTFGTDPVIWDAASPLNNIETEEGLPSFFVVVQGSQRRIDQNIRFVEKVNQTETKT